MTSSKFKQELKQEAEQWRTEGLISPNVYDTLARRYQFSNLKNSSNDRFIAVVITFGCILLGLAVITFVAANWQVWSKTIKVSILISSFLITNISGFYLWQKANTNWQARFGQGLLLVGALILGANLGLMSQMFHQTGELYELYFIWGFAVLLMAYGLSLTSLGIIAILLIVAGYFSSFSLFDAREFNYFIQLIPLIVSCSFIPLAYRCRSSWLFFLTSCITIFSFSINCLENIDRIPIPAKGFLLAIAFMIPLGLFWSYKDKPKLFIFNVSSSFAALSRKIAVFYLSIFLYLASFNEWWNYSYKKTTDAIGLEYYVFLCLQIGLFAIVAFYWWYQLGKRLNQNARWRLDRHSIYIGIAIVLTTILLAVNFNNIAIGFIGTIVFNLLLFGLGLVLVRHAFKSEQRLGYWSGISLLSLQVVSRMIEYNTGLLTKALVLFCCGVGIIIAGIWFEKYIAKSQLQ